MTGAVVAVVTAEAVVALGLLVVVVLGSSGVDPVVPGAPLVGAVGRDGGAIEMRTGAGAAWDWWAKSDNTPATRVSAHKAAKVFTNRD